MGFFSSSKSSSSTTSNTVNQSTDKRVAVDNGGIGLSGDSVSLVLTDDGAIAAGSKAVEQALSFARLNDDNVYKSVQDLIGATDRSGALLANAFEKTNDTVAGAYSTANGLIATAYDNARGEGTQKNYVAAAAIAAVVLVALVGVWGRK